MNARRNALSHRLMLGAALFTFAVSALLAPSTALAGDKAKDSKGASQKAAGEMSSEMVMQAAMAEMMKFATPGPMHELLRSFVGTWKTDNKSWMGPGDPVVSQGTCKREMVLGGRFLESTYEGDMMGQHFEGIELLGYDQRKNEFVSVWMDNMGTGMQMSNGGKADPSGKVITVNMMMDDPIAKKPIPYKMITKIIDANKHVFTMIGTRDGKEVTEMEVTYTRMN